MSDEDREALRRFGLTFGQLRELVRPIFKALQECWDALRPLIDKLVKLHARVKWQAAQRTARLIAHHPDLAGMDRWLDRMYTDPAIAWRQ